MPLTLTYDISNDTGNHRTYIRSALERFGWERLGGSVFRYKGRAQGGSLYEDWLNDVAPSIMFFRSYVLQHTLELKFFTIDASSASFLDFSDPTLPLGTLPCDGSALPLVTPKNNQSSTQALRDFVDAATAAGAP